MNKQTKNNLIDKINLLNDANIIKALNSILDNLNTPASQKLKEGEKELIRMGLEDFRNGRMIDDADLRQEEDEWLKE